MDVGAAFHRDEDVIEHRYHDFGLRAEVGGRVERQDAVLAIQVIFPGDVDFFGQIGEVEPFGLILVGGPDADRRAETDRALLGVKRLDATAGAGIGTDESADDIGIVELTPFGHVAEGLLRKDCRSVAILAAPPGIGRNVLQRESRILHRSALGVALHLLHGVFNHSEHRLGFIAIGPPGERGRTAVDEELQWGG